MLSKTITVKWAEVMPIFFQRSTNRASTCNSGEDTVAIPIDSEVADAQIVGMLASPLYTQEREASADPSRAYHSNRENSVSNSSFFDKSAGKPAPEFSHKRKSITELHSDTGGVFGERQQVKSSWNYEQIKPLEENRKLYPHSLKRNFVREFVLENKEEYTLRGKIRNTSAGIES